MKQEFSKSWKSSVQTRKQRKYRAKAPLHIKSQFLSANLSKDLRQKYGKRNTTVKTGDKVKILRGEFSKKEGKIESVNLKTSKIYIQGIEKTKKDGTKIRVPINPSNLQIVELDLKDKKRKQKFETGTTKTETKTQPKNKTNSTASKEQNKGEKQ